uniref:Uncharacterized protein n=1 Tax=Kalanchoe fedtschenkoi TaxID=63787 RepID=A0A7N0TLA0_KALFE
MSMMERRSAVWRRGREISSWLMATVFELATSKLYESHDIRATSADAKILKPRTEEPYLFTFRKSEPQCLHQVPRGLEMGIGTMARCVICYVMDGSKNSVFVMEKVLHEFNHVHQQDDEEG